MSRKDDYIPTSDADIAVWLRNFQAGLEEHLDDLRLTPADVAFLADEAPQFETLLEQHRAKQNEARAATAAKNRMRASIERRVRSLVRVIADQPKMDNGLRGRLGLNARSMKRERHLVGPEVPGIRLETLPGSVIVHFGTTTGNEWLNTKPKWARGCNIYRQKSGESSFQLVACATTSPYNDRITEAAVNVAYAVQYVGNRASDLGQCSPPTSIAAGTGSELSAA